MNQNLKFENMEFYVLVLEDRNVVFDGGVLEKISGFKVAEPLERTA